MKYTAFISYNSKDDNWAKWLQRKLESYNLPVFIKNEQNEVIIREKMPKKIRVFRYRTDLNTISLSKGLAKELDESRWLIVICSPYSAKSQWVGKEIQYFIDTGRKDKIIPFIVSGTSYSNDFDECLNPILKNAFLNGDILGVNIDDYGDDPRIYRKQKALVRIVSILIEVPDAYGFLWNRYRLRFWENIAFKTVSALLTLAVIAYVWQSNVSFDCQFRLNDETLYNQYLPVPDSLMLYMELPNEQKKVVLNTMDTVAVFKNIPGQYVNSDVKMTFHAYGYMLVDTVIRLQRNGEIVINIQRNDTYEVLSGKIIDENGNPINDALIDIEGIASFSASDGSFEVHVPIMKQKPRPHVIISKHNYKKEVFTEQPIGRDWNVILRKQE